MIPRIAFLAALALAACNAAPGTNTNGTPTTAAEQAVGASYGLYDAAVAAETAWLENSHPAPATVMQIANYRQTAYAAINAARNAASTGASNASVAAASAQAAITALVQALAQQGVHVSSN